MDKDEALSEFLKSLRIVFNNASAYQKDHPYFIKSIHEFSKKFDNIFQFLNPLVIGITPNSLFVDGRYWEKLKLYEELASLFHLRKIKSIEFRIGLSAEELISFFNSVSNPIKEIIAFGGIKDILAKANIPHINIVELDYSELLHEEGESAKDVWAYLFGEALAKSDSHRIGEFADNFEKIIRKFNVNDLSENDELRENLQNFLLYLKDNEKARFKNCSKELFRMALGDKGVSREDKLEKIKIFFKDLDKEALSGALCDVMLKDEDFDYLSFSVFSRLIKENDHKEMASLLEDKLKRSEAIKSNPRLRKRIKELLSSPESQFIPAFYRHALSSLEGEGIAQETFVFEKEQIQENYRFLLLNLVEKESEKEWLDLIFSRLLKECLSVTEAKDFEFLKAALEILYKKAKDDASLAETVNSTQSTIATRVQDIIFERSGLQGLDILADALKTTSLGPDFYLDKIFNERKVSREVIKLFLKFFPHELNLFFKKLDENHSDIELLGLIINSLQNIDSPASFGILKQMVNCSSSIIKVEALRSMRKLSSCDDEFLFGVVKDKEAVLRKEALKVMLDRNNEDRREVTSRFLSIPLPIRIRKKIILENIAIIADIGLKEARDYLVSLSRKHFFWNKSIRQKASEVLKGWDARKD